ncbi:hypothetical protein QQS21_001523 [Conoideocrella luteorostrata]|uniref:Uncharacterized protein n=1 Tax=Conoideocrella luteorostrata TaxID=1105319 RepID=A0AAJ0G1Z2_9HYPO|nr:hypothetical protein QQS21_001523 [Conoideocrella luteorostrata]
MDTRLISPTIVHARSVQEYSSAQWEEKRIYVYNLRVMQDMPAEEVVEVLARDGFHVKYFSSSLTPYDNADKLLTNKNHEDKVCYRVFISVRNYIDGAYSPKAQKIDHAFQRTVHGSLEWIYNKPQKAHELLASITMAQNFQHISARRCIENKTDADWWASFGVRVLRRGFEKLDDCLGVNDSPFEVLLVILGLLVRLGTQPLEAIRHCKDRLAECHPFKAIFCNIHSVEADVEFCNHIAATATRIGSRDYFRNKDKRFEQQWERLVKNRDGVGEGEALADWTMGWLASTYIWPDEKRAERSMVELRRIFNSVDQSMHDAYGSLDVRAFLGSY